MTVGPGFNIKAMVISVGFGALLETGIGILAGNVA